MNCLRLSKSMVLLFLFISSSLMLLAQDQTVTGKVIDRETGRGIVGVTVKLKNSNTATQTDADGNFTLRVPSAESIITFSSVGYLDYEVKAGTGPISVTLTEFNSKMDEVVVVGYGTKKRVNVQGAVSTIKAQEIEDLPVANLQSALVNRVPGVNVSFSSGKPGSTTNITIRNPTTFPNGAPQGITSQPLIVIDGIISNPTIWNQSTNADFLASCCPVHFTKLNSAYQTFQKVRTVFQRRVHTHSL